MCGWVRERERETIVPKTLADNNNWKREGESEPNKPTRRVSAEFFSRLASG